MFEEILEVNGEKVISTLGHEGDYKVYIELINPNEEAYEALTKTLRSKTHTLVNYSSHDENFLALSFTTDIADDMSKVAKEFEVEFANLLRLLKTEVDYEIEDVEFDSANINFRLTTNIAFLSSWGSNGTPAPALNEYNLKDALKLLYKSLGDRVLGGDRMDINLSDLELYNYEVLIDDEDEEYEIIFDDVEISGRIPKCVFSENGCHIYVGYLHDLAGEPISDYSESILKPYFRGGHVVYNEKLKFDIW